MSANSFRELIVWQRSMELVKEIYVLTKSLPADEQFGLVSQLRRAAISISSNIAEGHHRSSTKEYIRFLYMAYGSSSEIDAQLSVVEMLFPDISIDFVRNLLSQTAKMLNAMIGTLEKQESASKYHS